SGEKPTTIVQMAPAGREAVHVFCTIGNSAPVALANVMFVEIVVATRPMFLTVRGTVGPDCLTTPFPKFNYCSATAFDFTLIVKCPSRRAPTPRAARKRSAPVVSSAVDRPNL